MSMDRLVRFLNTLNQDIEIVIKERPRSKRQAILSVVTAWAFQRPNIMIN